MVSPDLLNVPLSEDEAAKVREWMGDAVWLSGGTPVRASYAAPTFEGKTPEYVALMLRMDGYTSVRDRDVMKAAGRL